MESTSFIASPFASLGIQLSSILRTWLSKQSLLWQRRLYMEGIPALIRTSLWVTLSFYVILRMHHRYLKVCSLSSYLCRQSSSHCRRVAMVGFTVSFLFSHTRLVSQERLVTAFPILLSSSTSRERFLLLQSLNRWSGVQPQVENSSQLSCKLLELLEPWPVFSSSL